MMKLENIRTATDTLRDLRNWLAVFQTEYDIPDEAYQKLHDKIEEIGSKMDGISCEKDGVDAESIKPVSNAVRETTNWLAVFADEYDLNEEAVQKLNAKLDEFAEKLANIECA